MASIDWAAEYLKPSKGRLLDFIRAAKKKEYEVVISLLAVYLNDTDIELAIAAMFERLED
jgi:hypothetical protein